MSKNILEKLIEERTELLEKLASLTQLLHGSWVERYSVCSRPNCKCKQGERHGPRHYLVINQNGRQRQKYIPKSQAKAAQNGIAQYRKLQKVIDRITEINLILIKEKRYEHH